LQVLTQNIVGNPNLTAPLTVLNLWLAEAV